MTAIFVIEIAILVIDTSKVNVSTVVKITHVIFKSILVFLVNVAFS